MGPENIWIGFCLQGMMGTNNKNLVFRSASLQNLLLIHKQKYQISSVYNLFFYGQIKLPDKYRSV